MGIPHVSVFHAHRSIAGNPVVHWRVNQTHEIANARRSWNCPEGGGMWYPGAALPAATPTTPRSVLTTAMHDWGVQLFNDGYVSTLGLRLMPETGDSCLLIVWNRFLNRIFTTIFNGREDKLYDNEQPCSAHRLFRDIEPRPIRCDAS